ncbi:MAG TPA: sulfate adenylyltransferase subunit CysN [Candidatus Acidoferrales bacterium]|jgi:sulfate adenylyltransferase large subunit|nr:sulfate adenylyltransferase subunit CysN [Candidatus Acidoferrales bacterium]
MTSTLESRTADWLAATAETELLRFTTAGSVDDGKSTLIGRLLYDSKGVYEDQLASVRKATRNLTTGGLDLSLLTDGLRAEREQGITIDVAYRYFSTPRRKFIIADTPGHEQYTRNMATGASTANLAIVLIDARYGVLPQSRRHAYIASLLGIPHIVVAVNKMDLMDFREDVFNAIQRDFQAFASQLEIGDLQFIPISALDGDNVVRHSTRTPWYHGPALLEHLETVPLSADYNLTDMRFPVQYVIRPNLDFRGFAGEVASGVIRRGDAVTVLPSGRTSRVKSIVTWDGELEEAFAPMSVTVCLEDEIDISRGDMLVHADNAPHAGRRFEASVVWMNAEPLEPNRPYLLKHSTQTAQARIREIRYRVDVNSLAHQPVSQLQLNEIAVVSVETQRPLFFDPYRKNRATGGFILIDPITNETLGAGMIEQAVSASAPKGRVTASERAAARGHAAFAICLEAGQQDLAYALERLLFDHGCMVQVIEKAENLRQAVRTCHAGGLIAIVVPAELADGQTVREALPPGRVVLPDSAAAPQAGLLPRRPDIPPAGTAAEAARRILNQLDGLGLMSASQPPLTGGAGI